MEFSLIIKQRMADLKLTSSALAKQTGYSQQYISDLLSGQRRWNETTLSKVCEALGLHINVAPDEQAATLDATGTE